MHPRTHRRRILLFLGLALLAVLLSHEYLLRGLGHLLVEDSPPGKAQVVVVLAGDFTGQRILKAAELVRQGYAPLVMVSGPYVMFGRNEAEFAIDFALRQGFPSSYFQPVIHQADSTREEAVSLWQHLQQKGIRDFLLVTSDFHTRRSARVYRSVAKGANFRAVAAPTTNLDMDTWWKSRPSRKVIFMEWVKTVADWLSI